MPRSVRHRREAERDRLGYILLFSALLVGAGLVSASLYLSKNRPQLDQATMCPVDGPRGLIVLLVDTTDPLSPVQQADLKNHLQKTKVSVPEYAAVDVYTVGPSTDHGLLKSLGERICNPGDGRNASTFTSNPRLMKEKWEDRFSRPLDEVFGRMLNSPEADRSPIFESIQSVAVTAFGVLPERTKLRKLIIVSDMLHNTEEYSQYHGIGSFAAFRSSPYYRRVRADLRGVDVELYYLRRNNGPQGKQHIEFWQQYFEDSGATLVHVLALQG